MQLLMRCTEKKMADDLPIKTSLEPSPDIENELCNPDCPYLQKWDHPFYHSSAWCWKQMRDLKWHDFWIADCLFDSPNLQLLHLKDSGRIPHPDSES